jgi:hypothetical protein
MYAAGEGVKVVSFEECRDRIKVAIAARDEARMIDGNHILIVARTDCQAVLPLTKNSIIGLTLYPFAS